MYRVGMIGTGSIGRINAKALLDTNRAEITCLCNRTIEKAKNLRDDLKLSASVYQDAGEMICNERPDIVLICTPQDVHCEQFIMCAKQGISVFVEKPLAMDSAECQSMLNIQAETGIKACVCHTQRYRSAIMDLKTILDSGELGRIVSVTDSIDMQYFTEMRPQWCFDKKRARCAMLYMHGSHQIDRLMYLTGEKISWINACMESTKDILPDLEISPMDCGYHMIGAIGDKHFVIEGSSYSMPVSSGMIVRGTKGTAKMSLKDTGYEPEGLFISKNDARFRQVPLSTTDDESYLRQMNDFLDYLEDKPNCVPTLEHGAEVIRILEKSLSACCSRENSIRE